MPVKKGCSIEACKENMEKLLEEGKSRKEAYAIMANTARKYRKRCSKERQEEIMDGKFFGGA